MPDLEKDLRTGLGALGLQLTDGQVENLLAYQALILKWTKVYNLTAVREPADMLTHHLLDSLAVIPALQVQLAELRQSCTEGRVASLGSLGKDGKEDKEGKVDSVGKVGKEANQALRLLDVGSGAGLPGVVVAICCPELVVHCVDTVAKKAAFIQQVAVALKLPNLRGIHARVENLTETYAVVSSRAFASLVDFTQWSAQALAEGGIWMGMKGKVPTEEIAALPPAVKVFHVEPLVVPGLDAERCIVWMRRG